MTLEAVIIDPKRKPDACVIWLHGLGADGYDFVDAVPSLGLPYDHTLRFVFPHAPSLPISLNGGLIMPAWYDITAIDFNSLQDEIGIKKSEQELRLLINKNIDEGISPLRIMLIGFSQGGALALHTALRFEYPLAGVAVLSGYLPLHTLLEKESQQANKSISIFIAHGTVDPLVPIWMGQQSCYWLQQAGYAPIWHSYSIPHTVSVEELVDLGNWIKKQLPLQNK